MEKTFKSCDRKQMLLLPPSLLDWLPEGHLAHFILDTVEQLDLSEIYALNCVFYRESCILLWIAECIRDFSSNKFDFDIQLGCGKQESMHYCAISLSALMKEQGAKIIFQG